MQRRYLAILGLLVVLTFIAPAHAQDEGFDNWLQGFKHKARVEGISQDTIDRAFEGITEDEEVVRLDRKQPENKITLTRYLKNTISPRRISTARAMMDEHRDLLKQVSAKYGVQPEYIVALWAIESDFGNNKGNFSVVQSLATLAYEGRRAQFFAKELIAALKIMDADGIELSGSWAGAMGDCQFMPSTYLNFAVDGNGDGKRDIWNEPADIFSSIANYLHSLDWNKNEPWGYAVSGHIKPADINIKRGKTASQWRKRGLIIERTGSKVRGGDATYYAIYPGSKEEGVYLVSENFQALLNWNRSRYFATAVGTLADAIGE